MISIVVAYDENRGIGYKGGFPWAGQVDMSEDMRWFKELTQDSFVIMGRKTWDSLPLKPLPNRWNIILSRTMCPTQLIGEDNVRVYRSLDSAINICQNHLHPVNSQEIFIIGGEQIYRQALELGVVDRIYFTQVWGIFKSDTFFPSIPTSKYDWTYVPLSHRCCYERGYYQRVSPQ